MKAVVIVSGGMVSVTLLYHVVDLGYAPSVLSFNYGQRHKRELESAKKVCALLGLEHKVVDITSINQLLQGSALTSDIDVPKGHYAEDNMKLTVVPSRNTIFLALASGYAVSIGASDVFFGAHKGDSAQYPDCRPQYVHALNKAFMLANFQPVTVHAPFVLQDKADIAKLGLKLQVPFELTWTCYEGKERPCLQCGSCVERTYAFLQTHSKDPLLTEDEWTRAVLLHDHYQEEFDRSK